MNMNNQIIQLFCIVQESCQDNHHFFYGILFVLERETNAQHALNDITNQPHYNILDVYNSYNLLTY